MMKNLLKTIKLQWIKIVSRFKKRTMESLVNQIENCLNFHVFNTISGVTISSSVHKENGKAYQVNYTIMLHNCCGFTLVINFRNIDAVEYTMMDNTISDIDLLQQVMVEFTPKLNTNKPIINAWIAQYISSRR